jgi:hypothetical protein
MDGDDCHEHRRSDPNRAQGAQQSESEQQPAADLGSDGSGNPKRSRPEAHMCQMLVKPTDTRPAPPAEELLSAVPGKCEADEDAKDKQAGVHF